MSFQLPARRVGRDATPRWSGSAVLVESMLLLVFLIASLAIFTQMFSASLVRAEESGELTTAVAAATEVAERFAADPVQAGGAQEVDGMRVVCDVQEEAHRAGTLYRADIAVYATDGNEPVYSITTSRFESEVD